jgi:large subunit ribosomal protein L15
MPGLHNLKPAKGSRKQPLRRGRGDSAGQGSYSGRGHKGQRKRESVRPQFEGGQLPIVKRLPYLRGFTNDRFRIEYEPVNVGDLSARTGDAAAITPDFLRAIGLVRRWDSLVKVLGEGEATRPLNVSAHAVSASARAKIEAAGGTVSIIPPAVSQHPQPVRPPRPERAESEPKAAKADK